MNDLIAEPEQWTRPPWFEGTALGVPVLGSAFSAGASLGSGDWAGLLGSGANVIGDAVGIAIDPLGTLASSVAGFLLDRCSWFQEALNVLVGNPAVVTAVGITWSNVGDALDEQAERLIRVRDQSQQYWTGPAADGFRRRLTEQAEQASMMAFVCRCMNAGFSIGSGIVTVVREIVSAICAEMVGKLIVWIGQALATVGVGLGWIIPQATAAIARWVDDAAKWTDELLQSTGKFCDVLQKLYRSFDDLNLLELGITPEALVNAGANGVDQGLQTATG